MHESSVTSSFDLSVDELRDILVNTSSPKTPEPPYYIVSGSGSAWYLCTDSKSMVRIQRGSEIIPISEEPDSLGRVLVFTPQGTLLIPEDEVLDIGYN